MLTGSNEAPASSRQVGRKTGTRTGKKKDICTGRQAGITQTSRQTGTQRKKVSGFKKLATRKETKKFCCILKVIYEQNSVTHQAPVSHCNNL